MLPPYYFTRKSDTCVERMFNFWSLSFKLTKHEAELKFCITFLIMKLNKWRVHLSTSNGKSALFVFFFLSFFLYYLYVLCVRFILPNQLDLFRSRVQIGFSNSILHKPDPTRPAVRVGLVPFVSLRDGYDSDWRFTFGSASI